MARDRRYVVDMSAASTVASKYHLCETGAFRLSVVGGFLLLALHAVRALRREETTATLLAATVATAVFPSHGTAEAVHQTGQEETGRCSPHEGECLDADLGGLAVALEGIAALNKDGTSD